MASEWLTKEQALSVERALAQRAASELLARDERWQVTIADDGVAGTVRLLTRFGFDEVGPEVRVSADMMPEWLASVLTEAFQHPASERARRIRASRTTETEEPQNRFAAEENSQLF